MAAAPNYNPVQYDGDVIYINGLNNYQINIDNDNNRLIVKPKVINKNEIIYEEVTNSTILESSINEQPQQISKYDYRTISINLIKKINQISNIPFNTILRNSGFTYEIGNVNYKVNYCYIHEFNASIKGVDAFGTLKIIKKLSETYGYSTKIKICTSTGLMINYVFE